MTDFEVVCYMQKRLMRIMEVRPNSQQSAQIRVLLVQLQTHYISK